jgi:putative phosphoesterase
MKIGLISDTHGRLPNEVFSVFSKVDLIFHAGDIGSPNILIELEQIAPVKAVYGNVDTFPLTTELKPKFYYKSGRFKMCLTHIIGLPKNFAFELLREKKEIDLVIFGHTHKAEHTVFNNIHFINPGSACYPRAGKKGSVAILDTSANEPQIELLYL